MAPFLRRPSSRSFVKANLSNLPRMITAEMDCDACKEGFVLPHDIMKSILDCMEFTEVVQYRLVSNAWRIAVADCVECYFSTLNGRWSDTMEDGRLTPVFPKQLWYLLPLMADMSLSFRQSVRTLSLEEIRSYMIGDHTVLRIASCSGLTCISLSLEGCRNVTDVGAGYLAGMPYLEEVNLRGTNVSTVTPLLACKKLKKISLSRCDLTDLTGLSEVVHLEDLNLSQTDISASDELKECPGLKKLDLSDCRKLTQSAIQQALAPLSALVELDLSFNFMTDISFLSASTSLVKLRVVECSGLTNDGIRGLAAIPTLEDLNLRLCAQLTSVTSLATSKSLTSLDLSDCTNLDNAGIAGLEALPRLMTLNLSATAVTTASQFAAAKALLCLNLHDCRNLTDNGVQGLEAFPMLEDLELGSNRLTSVSCLSSSPKLRKVDLRLCEHLTDDGIQGLELIPTLEELHLAFCTKLTTVAHLSRCRRLRELNLQSAKSLTNAGIQGLELIPTLEVLKLRGTNVSSVAHLSACKALVSLNLDGCNTLDDSGIEGLEFLRTLEELDLTDTKVTTVDRFAGIPQLKLRWRLHVSSSDDDEDEDE